MERLFPHIEKQFWIGKTSYQISIYLDHKERVQEISIDPSVGPSLDFCRGLFLLDLMKSPLPPLLALPIWGAVESHLFPKGIPQRDQICRCFGVARPTPEMLEKIGSFNEFQEKTLAGAGCRSCLEDWREIFGEKWSMPKRIYRYKDIPVGVWILKIQEVIDQFVWPALPNLKEKIQIQDFQDGVIKLKISHPEGSGEDFDQLVEQLQESLRTSLSFELSLLAFWERQRS